MQSSAGGQCGTKLERNVFHVAPLRRREPLCQSAALRTVPLLLCRSGAYTKPLAGGFFFAPAIVKLAERVLSDVAAAGHSPFLGVHLRIEGDWPWGMRQSNDRDWKVGKRKVGSNKAVRR